MRRSTRRSSMALDSSLDSDTFTRVSSRRSSVVPQLDETRTSVGNFTTKFSMSSFIKKVEELNDEQRTAVERVGFGNLLRVPHHTLRKNLLVELMERWDCDKKAFFLLDRELTVSPVDAALILGLRATGMPVTFSDEEPFTNFEEEYGATRDSRKISVSTIERRLQSLGDAANEDFIRTFLLFTFGTLLFHNSNGRIDSRYVSFFQDLDKVADYAWGIAVIEDLFNWLRRRKEEQSKNMEGCLLLLQIWSYEHIDIGRPNLLKHPVDFPRACRWESIRSTSPRHWFTTKFDELEDNQVLWKLQPTPAELNIDVIRELLLSESQGDKVLTLQHLSKTPTATTRTSTQCTGLPPKSFSKLAAINEKKGGMGIGEVYKQADSSENSILSNGISVVTAEFPECSSSYGTLEVQEDQSETSSSPKDDYRVLKALFSKLKKDNVDLRRENDMMRNQVSRLSLNSKSELAEHSKVKKDNIELWAQIDILKNQVSQLSLKSKSDEVVIANLRKEVANQKEENQRLSSLDDVLYGVDMLINEYFDKGASHPLKLEAP